jgi:hypothetical protein
LWSFAYDSEPAAKTNGVGSLWRKAEIILEE